MRMLQIESVLGPERRYEVTCPEHGCWVFPPDEGGALGATSFAVEHVDHHPAPVIVPPRPCPAKSRRRA